MYRATEALVRGSNSSRSERFFVLQNLPDMHWGPHSLPLNKYRGTFLGIKRPGRRVDHSPPHRGEVKKGWRYANITPTSSWHGQGRDGFVEQICSSSGYSGSCQKLQVHNPGQDAEYTDCYFSWFYSFTPVKAGIMPQIIPRQSIYFFWFIYYN